MSTDPGDKPELADPFADRVFREPRQPNTPSVSGLNDRALGRLLAQFRRLATPRLPGSSPSTSLRKLAEPAQLVVSPQPGYGKSHLIGRLFNALEGSATLIYVTPFQSAGLCWQSVLLRTVQELTFPDRAEPAGTAAGEPATQFDAFAHGVLAHLVARLIETGRLEHPDPAGAAGWLRERPLEAFALADPSHPWSHWLRGIFAQFQPELEGELRRAGLALHSPGWLRVLFAYASSRVGDDVRPLCLGWLSGQTLESAEAARLGLRAGEVTPADLPDHINELCWRRLLDFCQLAGFYRPFVFCFDQTEAYGHSTGLARAFGTVIAQLHLMAANQMTVVTANQQPWEETVARHMENADKDRFVPLPLEGLNRAQAEELVRLRCAAGEVPAGMADAFVGGEWLADRFPTERNRMGTRQFLQACSVRWQQPDPWWQPTPEAIAAAPRTGAAAPPRPSLHALFDRYTDETIQKPRRLGYNPDVFRWLTEEAIKSRSDMVATANTASPRGYLPVMWLNLSEVPKVFIGFEPGDNWKRWRGILHEAEQCCGQAPQSKKGLRSKAVFFRTTEQAPIPGPRWGIAAEVMEARKNYLDLIELDAASTAELYAARTLFLDAAAGDLPYQPGEVLDFLAHELSPFWERIRQPI